MLLAIAGSMVTFVGKQSDLSEFLKSLLELEYDAIQAYSAAIRRLDDAEVKLVFDQFRGDHHRHVRHVGEVLRNLGVVPPSGADAKVILTEGKVIIGNLVGDRGILMAMRSNEDDTNIAYERALERDDVTAQLTSVFSRALDDERRHRDWIDERLDGAGMSGPELVASGPAG